jgi:AmmeMemoRadiSam system protein A
MSIVAAFAVPHPPLIIPGVADDKKAGVAHTIAAYREVARKICSLAPDTVFISSPHATCYSDYIHLSPGMEASGDFGEFGAPQQRYEVQYDAELVDRICFNVGHDNVSAGIQGERDPRLDHGTMIPIHFIQEAYEEQGCDMPLFVRCGISGLSPAEHYRFGKVVETSSEHAGRRVVYVASGDLAHRLLAEGPYGYSPDGPRFDSLVCGAFSSGNFMPLLTADPAMCDAAGECGLRSFQIMAGALDMTPVDAHLLSYEGPYGVGYGVASFVTTGRAGTDTSRDFLTAYENWSRESIQRRRSEEDAYVALARESLETYVLTGERIAVPEGLPAELYETRAGAFVSIKENGELRGCIGTIMPQRASLASEICANAIAAGTQDPRFSDVTADELDDLVYDVDVLTDPEPCELKDLDPKRYGVIVSTPDGRRGLLLPDLEGINSVDEQVSIAARKGGIALGRDEVSYQRFRVTRHV